MTLTDTIAKALEAHRLIHDVGYKAWIGDCACGRSFCEPTFAQLEQSHRAHLTQVLSEAVEATAGSQWDGVRQRILKPGRCGQSGHFEFQENGNSCLMCQRDHQLIAGALAAHSVDGSERDDAASLLASATDLLNSWARESSVQEADRPENIKGVIDRLWSELSTRIAWASAHSSPEPAAPASETPTSTEMLHQTRYASQSNVHERLEAAPPASDPNVGRLEIRRDGICRCVEEVPNGLRWKLVLTNEQLESAIKFAAESERLRGEAKESK